MTNQEWIKFLCEHWNVSKTIAKEMLHEMHRLKRIDKFNKEFYT